MLTADKHEFSIITIVNRENIYQEFKKSLSQQQQVDYELIKINNDNNQPSVHTVRRESGRTINCIFIP